jgi:hypothetical protein
VKVVEADPRRGTVADQVAWMEREGLVPGQRPTKRQIRARRQDRESYYELRRAGLCVCCRRPSPRWACCRQCREKRSEQIRARYRKKARSGVCPLCGGERGDMLTCLSCRGKKKVRALARRKRLIADGLCETCALPRGEDGTRTRCRECARAHVALVSALATARLAADRAKLERRA